MMVMAKWEEELELERTAIKAEEYQTPPFAGPPLRRYDWRGERRKRETRPSFRSPSQVGEQNMARAWGVEVGRAP